MDAGRPETAGTPTRKPAFFDEVDGFLSEKPCPKPKVVINSSQIFIGDGTENSEEEGEGKVENIVPNLPSCSSSSISDSNNINGRGHNSKFPEPQKDACVTRAGKLSKLSPIGRPNNRPRQNVSFNIDACAVS